MAIVAIAVAQLLLQALVLEDNPKLLVRTTAIGAEIAGDGELAGILEVDEASVGQLLYRAKRALLEALGRAGRRKDEA